MTELSDNGLHSRELNFKCLLVVGLLATLVGSGCFTARHQEASEPSYQGRSLSDWLRDFENPAQPEDQAMAAEAVRHIGAPAVPFLMERLKEGRWEQYSREQQEWQAKHEDAADHAERPENPRHEAFAALDALGPVGSDALPALEKLLHDNPPDPGALYVITRMGPAGVPVIKEFLASDVKILRLEANVCMEMITSHSETLYPQIPVGPDAPSFDRRICEFNLKILQAAYLEYAKERPDSNSPTNFEPLPPPSIPVPVQ